MKYWPLFPRSSGFIPDCPSFRAANGAEHPRTMESRAEQVKVEVEKRRSVPRDRHKLNGHCTKLCHFPPPRQPHNKSDIDSVKTKEITQKYGKDNGQGQFHGTPTTLMSVKPNSIEVVINFFISVKEMESESKRKMCKIDLFIR